jgi:hypothetical protein
MDKEKYIAYLTSEDFILDKEFCVWVLHPDIELDQFWNLFLTEHPEKEELINSAIFIVKAIQPIEEDISEQKLNDIFQKITKSGRAIKLSNFRALKYAAGIALLMTVGSLIWLSVQMKNQFPLETASEAPLKGKVIFANGSSREFDTERSTLKQTTAGSLTINNDTVKVISTSGSLAMNQIIIPYGKRSEITLSDGTHIWINSGSQLSYPTKFKSDSREVFLSGEAFFDVKTNPDKPFYVITKDIRIKVLGTRFNVSSYTQDNTTQTVLVKGKISAAKNKLFSKNVELIPGERLVYNKNNENLTKDRVDVSLYASWVNGYLIFRNVPISTVYKKIERYYNQTIVLEDGLDKITFSGKLDFKDNIKDVLENISFASSLQVVEQSGSYLIKK